MSAADRAYRILLRAYPRTFRATYEDEMVLVFHDQRRERGAASARFWLEMVWDVVCSAPALRAEAWRRQRSESSSTLEGIMKIVVMLTVVLGVYGAVAAVIEVVAASNLGMLDASYLLAVVLGGLAAALLLTAGVAVRRGTPSGRQTAMLAALASLIVVVAARFVHPWMSIFSQLVGIGVPIVLLVALRSSQRVAG
jgi:hypothetical protein